MKMKRIAIRFIAGLFLAAAVLSPAHADEHREDIIKLVEMTGTLQIVDQMITTTIPQLLDLLRAANSSIPGTVMRELGKVIESEFRRSLPEMLDGLVILYEATFSPEEINDLIVFYQSPTGKKIIETMPQLTRQSMALGNAWGVAVGKRAMERIIREARAKGYDL